MRYSHIPVLKNETIDGLKIKDNGIYIDGTVGGAGHSIEIAKKLIGGKLICNDLDYEAIKEAKKKLDLYKDKVFFINDNYKNLPHNLEGFGINKVDGIVLDLGLSSNQIDNSSRGFSYMQSGPLDMRMDQSSKLDAKKIINEYSVEDLVFIFRKYGEEKMATKIAHAIKNRRDEKKLESTLELSKLVESVYLRNKIRSRGHPSKKVFQALRIAVNDELENLKEGIKKIIELLNVGGRICIISFHSLEDKIIKDTFVELEKECICGKESPICICEKRSEIKIITKKPLVPSEEEIASNSRSKSAKLRIAEKI